MVRMDSNSSKRVGKQRHEKEKKKASTKMVCDSTVAAGGCIRGYFDGKERTNKRLAALLFWTVALLQLNKKAQKGLTNIGTLKTIFTQDINTKQTWC